MKPISVMLKPSSSACNLQCTYCFYHSLSAQREAFSHGNMSEATLTNVLQKAFHFADGGDVMLSFQGGEPLLRGKDFFRLILPLSQRYNTKHSRLFVGVQTNGTLIDDEWCAIFSDLHALVGISIDGDEYASRYRVDTADNASFPSALRGAKLLQKHGVDFNVLSVVTKQSADRIDKIYAFFKSQGFRFLQFIPCLKPFGHHNYAEDTYMNADDYTRFLTALFRLYLADFKSGNYVSIRLFDNMVRLAHGERAEQCGLEGHCTHQYVIEGDGAVYPCDFYCLDEYYMGNVNSTDFESLEKSDTAARFITSSCVIEDKCKSCDFFRLCRGGCKRESLDLDKCTAYRRFFPYALPYLQRMN